jgi:spore maturation protein CgeB
MCSALGAKVMNARERSARLAIEAQMPALYRSSRYCLSMSPLAPGYTSVRTYSILACGGLMLLHRFPGAERIFNDGEHAVLFDTAEEAQARMAELDTEPELRARIADAGRRLHAERHTVAHRIVTICRQVTGTNESFPAWL